MLCAPPRAARTPVYTPSRAFAPDAASSACPSTHLQRSLHVHHTPRSSPFPCAACLEKPVASIEGVTVCAVVGFHTEPIDSDTVRTFIACNRDSSGPQCDDIFSEYASATGCTPECDEAFYGGPRNAVCDAIPDFSEATCLATVIPAVCPKYPPPKLASDVAVATPPPPVQVDGPLPGSVDVDEDMESSPKGSGDTRGVPPHPGAAPGPDFGSTPSPSAVETIQESGTSAAVVATIVACAAAFATVGAVL